MTMKKRTRTDYFKQRRKVKKKRKFLQLSLLLLLGFIFVVFGYAFSLLNKVQTAADEAFEPIDATPTKARESVEPAKDNVSVLLLGIDNGDSREDQDDENSRTDAMLVATFNPKMKTIKLLSIPRDTYVYIPEVGYKDKITHAHAFGGVRASVDAVEDLLDIPIHYYIKMNFNAFIDVVDALGGIDVEVPYERIEKDENDQNSIHLEPGLQHLDGRHALALARTRKLDSDFDRGKRQQMIIEAMVERASSISSVTRYGDIIDALGANMKTNMTLPEMFSFFEYTKKGTPRIDSLNLLGTDDWSTGIYYYKVDTDSLDHVQTILRNHLGLSTTTAKTADTMNNKSMDEN